MTRCVADKWYKADGNMVIYLACDGHANFADRGKDIVCAAVSALCLSLANTLKEAGIPDASIVVNDGLFIVNALVESDHKYIEGAFDMAVAGLRDIAEQYPDHVFFGSGVSHSD